MNGAMESREIPWDNCVGLSVDNTSVNMGKHNSIQTRAVQKKPRCLYDGLSMPYPAQYSSEGQPCIQRCKVTHTSKDLWCDYLVYAMVSNSLLALMWMIF